MANCRRGGPGKLAIAARLRSETILPMKWIAARMQTGTAKGAQSVLQHLAQSHDQRKTAKALEPCAQLEFQSTVGPPSNYFSRDEHGPELPLVKSVFGR